MKTISATINLFLFVTLFSFTILSCQVSVSHAAQVRVEFTARVNHDVPIDFNLGEDDRIVGHFEYDTNISGRGSGPTNYPAITDGRITINSNFSGLDYWEGTTNSGTLQVWNDIDPSGFGLVDLVVLYSDNWITGFDSAGSLFPPLINVTEASPNIGLVLSSRPASILFDESLESVIEALELSECDGFSNCHDAPSSNLNLSPQIVFVTESDGSFIEAPADVTSLEFTVIPVPAAFYLFGSALLGMVGITRKKVRDR